MNFSGIPALRYSGREKRREVNFAAMRHCGIPAEKRRKNHLGVAAMRDSGHAALRQCGIAAMRHCGNAAERREGKSFLHSVIAALRYSGRKKRSKMNFTGITALRLSGRKKRKEVNFAALRQCGIAAEKSRKKIFQVFRHYFSHLIICAAIR